MLVLTRVPATHDLLRANCVIVSGTRNTNRWARAVQVEESHAFGSQAEKLGCCRFHDRPSF